MIKLKEHFSFKDPFITAASGLVHKDNTLYIVSDDEQGMISLTLGLDEKPQYHPIFDRKLPEDYEKRKKAKPDFECITLFSNSLLLIPSGSTDSRVHGAIVNLENFKIQTLSFNTCFSFLSQKIPELNIEGAVINKDRIILLQRGNGSKKFSALIELELQAFLKDKIHLLKITPIDLGYINNTHLGFTDATIYNGLIYFLSAAEASDSTYHDGRFEGAFLGVMDFDGTIQTSHQLEIDLKPEGVTIIDDYLYLVTDSDNKEIESKLFKSLKKI